MRRRLTVPEADLIQQEDASMLSVSGYTLPQASALTLAKAPLTLHTEPYPTDASQSTPPTRFEIVVTVTQVATLARVNYNSFLTFAGRVFGVIGSALALHPAIRQVRTLGDGGRVMVACTVFPV